MFHHSPSIRTHESSSSCATVEANVYQKSVDYPDEWGNGYHVMLDTEELVTVRDRRQVLGGLQRKDRNQRLPAKLGLLGRVGRLRIRAVGDSHTLFTPFELFIHSHCYYC